MVCEYEREWRIEIHAAIYCDRYELCSLQCPCGESCLEGGGGYILFSQSFDEFHGCGDVYKRQLLLLIFSLKRPLGIYLWEHYQLKVVLSWPGCVLAATVVAFPLMYRNARAAFEQVDVNYIYAGRTLGLSEWTIFRKVVIPVAGPGIASGTILTFARALGEYGATSMLAGNILGKTRTMAVAIAAEVSAQN